MTGYYSPASILTESQKVRTTFELALDSQLSATLNNGNAIEPGTQIHLPIWLGQFLHVSEPGGVGTGSIASVDMPNALGKRVINAMSADPKSVDVRAQAQYFYGLAEKMLETQVNDELSDCLIDVSCTV